MLGEFVSLIIAYYSHYIVFLGPGYLVCARCSASGVYLSIEPNSIPDGCNSPFQPPSTQRCTNCSGTGKVWSVKLSTCNIHVGFLLPSCETVAVLYFLQLVMIICLAHSNFIFF